MQLAPIMTTIKAAGISFALLHGVGQLLIDSCVKKTTDGIRMQIYRTGLRWLRMRVEATYNRGQLTL